MVTRVTQLEVRVYPLVKKFLAYHFETAPFCLHYVRNPYATYLQAQLSQFDARDKQQPHRKYDKLTDRLQVEINQAYSHNYGNVYLSPYRESAFNDFVRQMFFDKLTDEVAIRTSLGVGLKTAIKAFLDRYVITEDELALKTAIEYYYRTARKQARHGDARHGDVRPGDARRGEGMAASGGFPDALQLAA